MTDSTQPPPTNFKELIDLWGGPTPFAADFGWGLYMVKQWSVRDSIPPGYWHDILNNAAERGFPVNAELMVRLASRDKDAA